MASNSFGKHFRITTWGESHGPAIGVVIDGCPSGILLTVEEIQKALDERKPGQNPYVSQRKESDTVEILSGLYRGKTTGAPISLLIRNHDVRSQDYEILEEFNRPGHADFTYRQKYPHVDLRGGGRASARETAVRVAAGAIAIKILDYFSIEVIAYLRDLGRVSSSYELSDYDDLENKKAELSKSPFFTFTCNEEAFKKNLEEVMKEGDSLGGIIECHVIGLPAGVGDPVYEKLSSKLAEAMLTIPASKGFEIGEGFKSARLKGSEMNDTFVGQEGEISFNSNHCGGLLGGISTGAPLIFRVPFKPASSIKKPQSTCTLQGENKIFVLPEKSRHDPAPVIRAAPVVKAMAALVILDLLIQKESHHETFDFARNAVSLTANC